MFRTTHLFKGAIVALILFTTGCASTQPSKTEYRVYVDDNNVILQGYDAVAFFTEGRAVPGASTHNSEYHGAVYHFANATNKERFDADPERYKPQFGGYCSMAMAMGKFEPGDATMWSIVDGRLVVQRNAKAKAMWNKNPRYNLRAADDNWNKLAWQL